VQGKLSLGCKTVAFVRSFSEIMIPRGVLFLIGSTYSRVYNTLVSQRATISARSGQLVTFSTPDKLHRAAVIHSDVS